MLSNAIRSLARQLLKKQAAARRLAGGLMGEDCLLCAAPCGDYAVCPACEEDLPRLGAACPVCAMPAPGGERCGECLRARPSFDAAAAAFAYRFPVDRLVRRFKDRADLALGEWMAAALAARVAMEAPPDLVVATPLAPARLHARGFNQAVELARGVAIALDLPFSPFALVKVRETEAQRGLDRAARLSNLRGAFACRCALRGRHVALVDDVVTTGATASAAAAALKAAGAARVTAWAFARTP